jgi:hypothetical protein
MDLIDKYLGEAKDSYLHIVDDGEEINVIHSVHDSPNLGGQEIKSFDDKKKAIDFAIKMSLPHKDTIMSWKKIGFGAKAKWKRLKEKNPLIS